MHDCKSLNFKTILPKSNEKLAAATEQTIDQNLPKLALF
jgi:hypothetical protein